MADLIGAIEELNKAVSGGQIELNRGMSSTQGIPSTFYAKQLFFGALYPGTLTALGNGMYFATPSEKTDNWSGFPSVSVVAKKYTKGDGSGILVRACLKSGSKVVDCDDLKQVLRENRNRAKSAEIADIGAFAAALGFDAFYSDGVYPDTVERVYVVLNRGAILVQSTCLLVKT